MLIYKTTCKMGATGYVQNYAISYQKRSPQAKAYHVAITQPLRVEETKAISNILIYSFGVDEPIPNVELPLLGDQVATLNFESAYNMTFERSRVYMFNVDYSQPPLAFDKYGPADQQRILARMQAAH